MYSEGLQDKVANYICTRSEANYPGIIKNKIYTKKHIICTNFNMLFLYQNQGYLWVYNTFYSFDINVLSLK